VLGPKVISKKYETSAAVSTSHSKWSAFLRHSILLSMLCFAVYANSLNGKFVWDDNVVIVRNAGIRNWSGVPHAFVTSVWSFLGQATDTNYYRPFQTVVYNIAYHIGGLLPLVYHLTSLILHLAVVFLIYFLCLQLKWASQHALIAAAIFASHPIHTEAVSWIAGAPDLLCGLFYVSALCLFFNHQNSGARPLDRRVFLSAGCFLGAMFSKEMGITFPLVAGLMLFAPDAKRRPRSKDLALLMAPYVLALGIYGAFRVAGVGAKLAAANDVQLNSVDWSSMVVWAVGEYVRYSLIPYPLHALHVVPAHLEYRLIRTLLAAGVVLIFVAVGWFSRRRIPSVWIWLAAFGLTLLPVLYFAGITSGFFAERYLYIPSIPITIAGVLFLKRLSAQRAAAVAICVVVGFSALTILRNRDWRDDERLFRSSSAVAPESVAVWNKLGFVYLNKNDNAEAAKTFAEALRCWNDPRSDKAWYQHYQAELGLGIALERQSQRPSAVEHLERALIIFPNGNEANAALGAIRINQNNYSEGMSLLEKAIRLSSADELARDYMGVALLNTHRYQEAAAYFREALTLNPDYTPAKHHLSMALNALGQ
jgi:hypothetical protein